MLWGFRPYKTTVLFRPYKTILAETTFALVSHIKDMQRFRHKLRFTIHGGAVRPQLAGRFGITPSQPPRTAKNRCQKHLATAQISSFSTGVSIVLLHLWRGFLREQSHFQFPYR